MSDIKRYDLVDCGSDFQSWKEMRQELQGEWVRWEDVEKYVREEVLGANKLGDKTVFFTETGVYISKDELSE